MKTSLRVLCAVCAVAVGSGAHAQVVYTFTNVADTSSGSQFANLGHFTLGDQGAPALNNVGTVAFWAVTNAGATGLFTKNGSTVTTIADTTTIISGGTITSFDNGAAIGRPSINDAGRVAFQATLTGGTATSGIFAGSGGTPTTIADTTTIFPSTTNPFANFAIRPSINAGGVVAFSGGSGPAAGAFTGTGGPLTTIASTGANGFFFNASSGATSINGSGTVAVHGNTGDPGDFQRIWRGTGGPLTVIASPVGPPLANSFRLPSMNASGAVAFRSDLDAGGRGIVMGNGGPPTVVADTTGPYADFGDPSINASGTIAFQGFLDSNAYGIFTGPDPVANKVIRTGDTLFGSLVTYVDMSSFSLNDLGQIAFFYDLSGGRNGIAIATPVPEPSSLALVAAAVGAGAALRRRRPSARAATR